jgi:transmembrane sensor
MAMMSDLPARDRREARKWMLKMLDRPDLHQEGLQAWLADRPDRQAHYRKLADGVGRASAGAEMTGMQPRRVKARRRSLKIFPEMPWGAAIATALVSVVMIAGGAHLLSSFRGPGDPQAIAATRLATRIGEVRPEKLNDGTLVTLDTGTAIDVTMNSSTRTIVLRHGRARFAVAARDNLPPLTVVDGDNSVIASSATFDVSDRGPVSALVVAGSADVRLRPASYFSVTPNRVRLDAGQKLVLTSGQGTSRSAIPARPSDAQWIGGLKSFDEVPVREVIAEANTYSDTKIVLADPRLGNRVITAELHIRDIEGVARGVAAFLSLDIERSQPNKLILVPKN